jgi:HK97 gp10 family phage protein
MKLESKLSAIADAADGAVSEALFRTAADIVGIAKQLAPIDTGALKQSIGAIPQSSTSVVIGSDKEYAPYVEYGTADSPAQPFLTPAFVQSVPTFKVRLAEAVSKRS